MEWFLLVESSSFPFDYDMTLHYMLASFLGHAYYLVGVLYVVICGDITHSNRGGSATVIMQQSLLHQKHKGIFYLAIQYQNKPCVNTVRNKSYVLLLAIYSVYLQYIL